MSIHSANQVEMLHTITAVAREKKIEPTLIYEALETALAREACHRYGSDHDIRVTIDRTSGRSIFHRVRTVVAEIDPACANAEMTVEEAKAVLANPEIGDEYVEEIPPVQIGHIAAQSARQIILQKLREAERERQYAEFKDRADTIIHGEVKQVEHRSITVDIGVGDGFMARREVIPGENFKMGDRVRCYIREVRSEVRGPQVILNRTSPEFMRELFRMEVPEIYEGIIEIKAVARDPGSRAKIAVHSNDSSLDPVGSCVGVRGSRVQAVVNELHNEKIDVIQWNDDPATLLIDAMQPAEITKVVEMDDGSMLVVVPVDQLSRAIGRRGQNVRLTSKLTGLEINIISDEEEAERSQKLMAERVAYFTQHLDIDSMFAQLLVSEDFTTLEEIAYVEVDELTAIQGIGEDEARELQARASEVIDTIAATAIESARALGMKGEILEFEGLTPAMLLVLAQARVFTLRDFAEHADWELIGEWTVDKKGKRVREPGVLEEFNLSLEDARNVITNARLAVGLMREEDIIIPEAPAEEDETPSDIYTQAEEHFNS